MAISHVNMAVATPGPNGGATLAIETTGASLLLIGVSWYAGGGVTALTVSDSKGNTWTPLTLRNTSSTAHRFYYAAAPTVGAGHTATVTATGIYPVVVFYAFAGTTAAPFDVQNGATATTGSTLATGSITPTASGALIVSGWAGMNATLNPTVTGLTQTVSQNPLSAISIAGAIAVTTQTSAAPINPTWAWTGADDVAVSVVAFTDAGLLPAMGIAFDTAVAPAGGAGSWAHTCSGSNRVLYVLTRDATLAGITYAGSALTRLQSLTTSGSSGNSMQIWRLYNPAAGTNTVVPSVAVSGVISASYSGAIQSGTEPIVTNASAVGATALTTAITTVADNSWLICVEAGYFFGAPPVPVAGVLFRLNGTSLGIPGLFDSGAARTPAGSHSLTTGLSGSAGEAIYHMVLALAPGAAAAAAVETAQPYVWGPM